MHNRIGEMEIKISNHEEEKLSLQSMNNHLKTLNDEQLQRLNDLAKKLTNESELTVKTLQKAINSSVRLCVVAPTVNVHVADKKNRFQTV